MNLCSASAHNDTADLFVISFLLVVSSGILRRKTDPKTENIGMILQDKILSPHSTQAQFCVGVTNKTTLKR